MRIEPDQSDIKESISLARRRNKPELWLERFQHTIAMSNDLDAGIAILEKATENNPADATLANRLKDVIQERDYLVATRAMENGEYAFALQTLANIDPDYRDTAVKIEAARLELSMRQALLDSLAEDSTRIDTSASALPDSSHHITFDSVQSANCQKRSRPGR
jgi:hypothetical protein